MEEEGILLDLLIAVSIYLDAKSNTGNPFVKTLGKSSDIEQQEGLKILENAFEDASHLMPKAEERLEEMRRAIMQEIEEEELKFDESESQP